MFAGGSVATAQVSPFVEYGATVHTGDNTPLWQVSNQQGLGSIYNNTYIRGGVDYKHNLGKWKFEEKLDMVAAIGMNFKSDKDIYIQQAYVDVRYKWLGLFAGSKERWANLLNNTLSSGGMTWSGNARPIPQIMVGIPEYLYILPRLAIKGKYHTVGLRMIIIRRRKWVRDIGIRKVSNIIIKKVLSASVSLMANGNSIWE